MKKKFKIFVSVLCIAIVMAVPIVALAADCRMFVEYDSEMHEVIEYDVAYYDYRGNSVLEEVSRTKEYHCLEDDGSDFEYTGNHWQEGTYHYYEFARTCYPCGYTESYDYGVKNPAGSYIEQY